MKRIVLLLALTMSAHSFAEVVAEFDQSAEVNCQREAVAVGCGQGSDAQITSCLEKRQNKLSKACQQIEVTRKKAKTSR